MTNRRPLSHRVLDVASLVTCLSLLGWLAARVVFALRESPAGLLPAAVAMLLGYVAADLASGVVHLLADHVGDERRGWLGRKVLRPFREHHHDPASITEHDYFETNGDSGLATLVLLVPSIVGLDPRAGRASLLVAAFVVSLSVWVVLTNTIHRWAHDPRAPRIARYLQRLGLVLSPEHHAEHHTAPYAKHYSITTGHSSWLIDRSVAPLVHRLAARSTRETSATSLGHS